VDRSQGRVGEGGEDQAVEVRVIAGLGGIAPIQPTGRGLFGELAQLEPAGSGVDVGAGKLAASMVVRCRSASTLRSKFLAR
jgi:hypothetical protein